mgnify:CR=1 FL=1
MALNVAYGKAGSGKSTYLFDYIKSNLNKEKIYVITPEQFSFTAEKKLLEVVKTGAVVNAEVLTFNRMAYRVLNEVGGITKTNLLASGKAMLIYEILLEQKNKFNFIGKSNENVELISTQITEFKKHGISVENLQNITENTKDMYLKLKMQDMQAIYDIYEQSLKNNYIDENDILTILAEKLVKSNLFDGTTIILDEFAGFTKQEYNIIKILLNKAKNIIVTICTDSLNESENKETDIFYANKQTWFKLLDVCQENGIKIGKQINMGETKRFKNAELRHLEKNVYSIPYHKYEPKVGNISLFLANNPYSEVEHLAKQIVKLVKNEDYRYKEIAVITKNIDTYSNLCKAIFNKYNIPAYIDEKKDLSQNILVKYLISILDVFARNWSYDSIFNYVKSGFTNIAEDDIYMIENYALKWEVKGSKWYKEDWNFKDEEKIGKEKQERLNQLRRQIVTPLINLKSNLSGNKTAKQISENLYRFFIVNKIDKILEAKIKKLKEQGNQDIATEYDTSWKIIMQVLDEIVLVFGEEKITFDSYLRILKTGLGESKLGTIPMSQDEVTIGDVDRSRSHKVRAVFIIGLNDGMFPSVNKSEGFLDDKDREQIKSLGVELAKGTIDRIYEDNFNIYKAFTTAEEKVYLSYSSSDMEGKSLRPSILISRIKKIFEIKEKSDIINKISEITTKQNTFEELLVNLCNFRDEKPIDTMWFEVYNIYNRSEKWKTKLEFAIRALNYNNIPEKLTKENIDKMYGETLKTSVSKLEKYSGCPFSYYLTYGLKLNDKETFQVQSMDTGTFMHDVIDSFFGELQEKSISIKDLEYEELEKIIAQIIEEKLKLNRNYIFTTTPKYKILTKRLEKVVTTSIKYIIQSLKQSDFEVFAHELEFGGKSKYKPITIKTEQGKTVEIVGKIDRVDILKNPDGTYVRIIDYKSSIKNIDLNQVESGLQLQLITYLNETCRVEDFLPAGVLYFNLINPSVSSEKNMSDEEIENKIKQDFKMKGLILADVNIIKKMDNKIEETGTSTLIPAGLKKDGEISSIKTSGVTKEQFEYLQKYTNKIIKQISESILDGNIEVKPYYDVKSKRTPCSYCNYRGICRFDENSASNKYNYISNANKEAVLELIKERLND